MCLGRLPPSLSSGLLSTMFLGATWLCVEAALNFCLPFEITSCPELPMARSTEARRNKNTDENAPSSLCIVRDPARATNEP